MKVLVIHTSPIIAHGLSLVLESVGIECSEITWDGYRSLTAALDATGPEVVLVDSQIPGVDSKRLVSTVSNWNKKTAVAIISIGQSPTLVSDAISAGANGYISLSVSDEEFVASLRLLAAGQVVATGPEVTTLADVASVAPPQESGKSVLTGREAQITELVADGLTNINIARRLQLTEGTVKVHMRNIFRKLGVSNRTELTSFAIRFGLSS